MNLLDLAHEYGLHPIRSASTNGGEYKSSCPAPDCGGKDRFILWPETGRYWCRQCHKNGDSIQFCREFMAKSYHEACAKLGIEKSTCSYPCIPRVTYKRFTPKAAMTPPEKWRLNAKDFALRCHEILLQDSEAICLLTERGLSLEIIKNYRLGWCTSSLNDQFLSLPDWGLPQTLNERGRKKKLWIPRGVVIPAFANEELVKLKIRRSEWKENDKLPKYVEVSGSMQCPALYGDAEIGNIFIVEAELDAILIQQFASDLCCCMAIGGAGKRPDLDSDRLLNRGKHLLYALDFDLAGKEAYRFWKSTYPYIRPWPTPKGKSPEAAFKEGINLRRWVESGIKACQIT